MTFISLSAASIEFIVPNFTLILYDQIEAYSVVRQHLLVSEHVKLICVNKLELSKSISQIGR